MRNRPKKTVHKDKNSPILSFGFLALLLLDDLVDVHDTFAFVDLGALAVADHGGELMDPVLVDAGAADDVVLEAEHPHRRRHRQLHLVAVSQLQVQHPPLRLRPSLVPDAHDLQKPEELRLH